MRPLVARSDELKIGYRRLLITQKCGPGESPEKSESRGKAAYRFARSECCRKIIEYYRLQALKNDEEQNEQHQGSHGDYRKEFAFFFLLFDGGFAFATGSGHVFC